MSDDADLRRELTVWKWLFSVTLVALVALIAYSGWRQWELRHRLDRIEEGYVVVTTRCMESLHDTTDLLASAQVVCAAVPRVEAAPVAPRAEATAQAGAAENPPERP